MSQPTPAIRLESHDGWFDAHPIIHDEARWSWWDHWWRLMAPPTADEEVAGPPRLGPSALVGLPRRVLRAAGQRDPAYDQAGCTADEAIAHDLHRKGWTFRRIGDDVLGCEKRTAQTYCRRAELKLRKAGLELDVIHASGQSQRW